MLTCNILLLTSVAVESSWSERLQSIPPQVAARMACDEAGVDRIAEGCIAISEVTVSHTVGQCNEGVDTAWEESVLNFSCAVPHYLQ